MTYKAPKAIINHPGVESCTDGAADSDYRHDIWLKKGWVFGSGRNAGGRGFFAQTVADFLAAEPHLVEEAEQ